MAVYSISNITVKDWDTYREYMEKVPPVIEKYGGKYLVRGGDILSDDTVSYTHLTLPTNREV